MTTPVTKMKQYILKYYNFYELNDKVDDELGFNSRHCGKHFYPDSGTFDEWCDSKGYGKVDSEGKNRSSSNIWFKEYEEDAEWKQVPYMDFWHWQLESCFLNDVRNDNYNKLYVGLDEFRGADWQLKIQKTWNKLFKNIANEEGYIDVWISW